MKSFQTQASDPCILFNLALSEKKMGSVPTILFVDGWLPVHVDALIWKRKTTLFYFSAVKKKKGSLSLRDLLARDLPCIITRHGRECDEMIVPEKWEPERKTKTQDFLHKHTARGRDTKSEAYMRCDYTHRTGGAASHPQYLADGNVSGSRGGGVCWPQGSSAHWMARGLESKRVIGQRG